MYIIDKTIEYSKYKKKLQMRENSNSDQLYFINGERIFLCEHSNDHFFVKI